MRKAVYPGTFDPITKGHMDVITRALKVVDNLIIAVAHDIPKTPVFSLEERTSLVIEDIKHHGLQGKVEVMSFSGLLVDFVKQQQVPLIIRGLRAVSDFEYEFQLSAMNSRLQPDVQTIFLPASEYTQFVASRLVKEVARLGGDVSHFVSAAVVEALKTKYTA